MAWILVGCSTVCGRWAFAAGPQDPPTPAPAVVTPTPAAEWLRNLQVSVVVQGAIGGSSATDAELRDLKAGLHDPRQRGVTLQQVELAVAGDVAPCFAARAQLVAALDAESGETIVELEEAFLVTAERWHGLEAKVGTYFTEFGRMNAAHPHQWDWLDQPVALSRAFGGDGMRGPGARLSWRADGAPFELTAGVQNADGETMVSFLASEEVYEERAVGGRAFVPREVHGAREFVWTGRAGAQWHVGGRHTLALGASVAFGPNATGADGDTLLYGADLLWRVQAAAGGHTPAFQLQGEFVGRAFATAAQVDASDPLLPVSLPATTLRDHGGYVQALAKVAPGWSLGLRVEHAGGSGASYLGGGAFAREPDPLRADRWRVSPLLACQLSSGARLRLQYDFDDSEHLGAPEHSLWLGCEVVLGAHPAHAR